MQEGKKGGLSIVVPMTLALLAPPLPSDREGAGGGGLKATGSVCVSCWMICCKDAGYIHGGAIMLARRCFLSKRASQSGRVARCGGRKVGVEPCRRGIDSRRWRGTIVTSSFSHRKATSDGVSPGGSGSAMLGMRMGGGRVASHECPLRAAVRGGQSMGDWV